MLEFAHPLCAPGQVFDWNDLRYVLAVARAGTLAGAARELGVKHTTVARRVEALEAALGTRLLARGAEGYTITAAGAEAVALAEELEKKADALARRVEGEDARVAGVVRVTLPETFAGYLVHQLPALRERHPELVVDLLADQRNYDLLAGEADLALRLFLKVEGDLIARDLCSAAWSLYAASAYVARRGVPATVAEYAGHDLLGYDAALATTPGAVWFRDNLPDARFAMRGNSILMVFNAAIAGFGIAHLPCFLGDAEATLARLTPEVFSNRQVRMLVHPDVARLGRVRAVMNFLVELFRRDGDLFAGKRPRLAGRS